VRVRFQADADLNQAIVLATIRREPAIDFRTATAGGFAQLADRDVTDAGEWTNRISFLPL
jgi:hypothetical protein